MSIKSKSLLVLIGILLIGTGIFLLCRDEIQQNHAEQRLSSYKPQADIIDKLENQLLQMNLSQIQMTNEPVQVILVPDSIQTESTENTENTAAQQQNTDSAEIEIQNLQMDYSDSIGWIYIPDTPIDYPLLFSGDNDFYMNHTFDGSYLYAGSIFLDGRCSSDFSDAFSILYGHNMNNGSMFAGLLNFTDASYFETHPHGWLFTQNGTYCIQFFSAARAEKTDMLYDTSLDYETRIQHLKEKSVIWKETDTTENDRLLSLSTCSYEFANARTILTGKLIPME